MDGRLGNLAEEFKQLVYPPGYDPDGKPIKRKQGGMKEYREKTIVSLNAYALFKFANKCNVGSKNTFFSEYK